MKSWWWWCSGFWCCVDSSVDANILEKHTVSIFRAEVVNGGIYTGLEEGKAERWILADKSLLHSLPLKGLSLVWLSVSFKATMLCGKIATPPHLKGWVNVEFFYDSSLCEAVFTHFTSERLTVYTWLSITILCLWLFCRIHIWVAF
jgi:hypothetical protein